jgi:hypothetical protein
MGPLVRSLNSDANLNVTAVGLRQPIYSYHDRASEAEQAAALEKYGSLAGNMEWLTRTIAYIEEIKSTQLGQDKDTPIILLGRSTGAALIAQAYAEYYRGNKSFDWVGKLDGVFLMGLDGHSDKLVKKWHAAELKYFGQEHTSDGDREVLMRGPSIFKDMNWQTRRPLSNQPQVQRYLPPVHFAVGAGDEFMSFRDALKPIGNFIGAHRGIQFHITTHDAGHGMDREGIRKGLGQLLVEREKRQEIYRSQFDPKALSYFPDKYSVHFAGYDNPANQNDGSGKHGNIDLFEVGGILHRLRIYAGHPTRLIP